MHVNRDGARWLVGTNADIAWIDAFATTDVTITSAIPPGWYDAYATVVLPESHEEQQRHDHAVIALLSAQSSDQRWWLGYLDTGVDDVVFPEAPTVTLYANWPYVLVQAGPEQAASWRQSDLSSHRSSRLPDLIFPIDRSWLISTLWDDDWTCIGGPVALIDDFLKHPDLGPHTRQVISLDEDATPPGHQAI